MKTKLVRMGNSRGIRIPKPLLEETGITGDVTIRVDGARLIVEASREHPRTGWEDAFARTPAHDTEEAALRAWTDAGSLTAEWDEEEWTWPETALPSDSGSTSSRSTPRSATSSRKRGRASSSRRRK